jgi:predicted ATPase
MVLERERELALLADAFAAVRDGRGGQFVLVCGEAGVGKTTLVNSFQNKFAEGARLLWGACDPLFTPRPLGPFVDIARTTRHELGALVRGDAKPYELADALIDELREQGPTVLVLEDVHWADEATLDVLRLLARRVASVPALVLVTYRDDELERAHPLRLVLGELPPAAGTRRLMLAPLSARAVAELAGPDGIDPDKLYRTTGGNPFFVTEVLAGGSELIPQTVRDAVLARAARLSPAARSLLDAAAVIPHQAELWLLEAIAAEAVEHADECLATGMLVPSAAGVMFRHELTRLAIEDLIPSNRRLEWNRKVLAALTDPPAGERDLARVAHHAEAAGDVAAVLRFAPQAAERAASLGAHREAAALYARALRYGERLPEAERADLHVRCADQLYMSSQFDEAIAAQQAALDLRRRLGDARGEGDSLRSLARLLFFSGRPVEAEPLLEEAVLVLERRPESHELAMAYGSVAQRRMAVSDTEGAVRWHGRSRLQTVWTTRRHASTH